MANLEDKLAELEDSIYNAEITVKNDVADMPSKDKDAASSVTKRPYLLIVAGLIPVLAAVVLYFLKPKFVTKKEKGKAVVDVGKVAKYVGMITLAAWLLLYILNYAGVLPTALAIKL